jgi:quercetin dioxygenase-like cupin family protein
MSNLADLKDIAPKAIWDGIGARMVHGEQITLAIVEIEPEGIVPEHHHPNEQLGMVLEGSVTFRIGDESRRLGPGGTWRITSEVPHEVRAGVRGAVVIDVFTPVRDDWQRLATDATRSPRWPG